MENSCTSRGRFGYAGNIEVFASFGHHRPFFILPRDAVGPILENGARLVGCITRLLVGLEVFTGWIAKFVLCGCATIQIGKHRFAVGRWNKPRVGDPEQTAAQSENDGKKEDDVEPRQRCVVLRQVKIDNDFLFFTRH